MRAMFVASKTDVLEVHTPNLQFLNRRRLRVWTLKSCNIISVDDRTADSE